MGTCPVCEVPGSSNNKNIQADAHGQLELSTVSSKAADGRGFSIPERRPLLGRSFKERGHGQSALESVLVNKTRIKIRDNANGYSKHFILE